MNIADLDYSANVNSGMRQIKCFFHAHSSPSEDNQKGCSSDLLLLGLQVGPKLPQGPTWKDFDATMVNIANMDYSADTNY